MGCLLSMTTCLDDGDSKIENSFSFRFHTVLLPSQLCLGPSVAYSICFVLLD